ncbi:hypothetical protein [Metamycoplasma hominis]|uniref:hypothetical protein n=1 Tax=Metamycoplasma hominis TaxID=2098 RepID=UPI0006402A7A|nr:hypothetical protein [Metamycoplasma hominis]AKJ52609.1 hypothetical protein MHOMSp_01840 [Metamycoplasma hominis]
MNQVEFYNHLISIGTNKKVASDHVSKLKRLENSICNCDMDEEYEKDKCATLLSLLVKNSGEEELKKVLIAPLPIGTYAMNTFRYSIKKYIEFRDLNHRK